MKALISRWRRFMAIGSGTAALCVVCCAQGLGEVGRIANDDIKGVFKNEKALIRGDTVVITFRLDAPADETYRIRIRLKKRDDPGFSRDLKFTRGDIGEGEFGQKSCRVIWLFRRELTGAELGEEYSFELTCELVDHGIPWWVYAGGGAAAVTAGVLVLSKKGGSGSTQSSSLPGPPDYRPAIP